MNGTYTKFPTNVEDGVRWCKTFCRERGHLYAGVQNGNTCYCGSVYGRHGSAESYKCNVGCQDRYERYIVPNICGSHQTRIGSLDMIYQNIYKSTSKDEIRSTTTSTTTTSTTTTTTAWSPPEKYWNPGGGCYFDNPHVRDMTGFRLRYSTNVVNAVEDCRAKCLHYKFIYAGLQSRDCYCDNSFGRYGQADYDKCNRHCYDRSPTWNRTICGGPFMNSVYLTHDLFENSSLTTTVMPTTSNSGLTAPGNGGNLWYEIFPTTTTTTTTTTTHTTTTMKTKSIKPTPYVPHPSIRRGRLNSENDIERPFWMKNEILGTLAGIIFIAGFTVALAIVQCAKKRTVAAQTENRNSRNDRREHRRQRTRERRDSIPLTVTQPPEYRELFPEMVNTNERPAEVNTQRLEPSAPHIADDSVLV